MDDQPYVNRFEDVHKKVKAFKDHARDAKAGDAELREARAKTSPDQNSDEPRSSTALDSGIELPHTPPHD